jgi:mannose/fructose/N-acetylgalactosamine-specific phosphotransferase system component IID
LEEKTVVKNPSRPMGRGVLWKMVLRSFFLQSAWNYQRMQNLGFLFTLFPLLRRVFTEPRALQEAAMRHSEFFNSHPYSSALIFGVVAKYEEQYARGEAPSPAETLRVKQAMMGPMAALGDIVFWGMLKPACALLGAATVWVCYVGNPRLIWLGPALFLLVYNVFHLLLRIGGIYWGYRRGIQIVMDLRQYNPQLIISRISQWLGVATAALVPVFGFLYPLPGIRPGASMLLGCLFAATGFVLLKWKLPSTLVVYAGLLGALLWGWMFL